MKKYDAVVVGSGPNGYACGIRLLQQGLSVLMLEANAETGGGLRSSELTLPGFIHDVGSTVHPLAYASPYLSTLPLKKFGLEWLHPEAPVAHPLEGGHAIVVQKNLESTAAQLGRDSQAYQDLLGPAITNWDKIAPDFLGPLRFPNHPFQLARFGLKAVQPLSVLNKLHFKEEPTKALLAGLAAHGMLPLDHWVSSGIAMVLGTLAHKVGWPFPRGGAQNLSYALDQYFRSMGGEVRTLTRVRSVSDLPPCRIMMLDTAPQLLLEMGGIRLPWWYRKQLKAYRYGQGVFKMDWALSEPIPFANADCKKAATIHIGASYDEIAASEKAMWNGEHSLHPYVLLVQSSLFDPSRAPAGKHTAWAYCHVPAYSTVDMSEAIENQIERFAPGFKDTIIGRHTMNTREIQSVSANYIGGDINAGAQTLSQLFTRPVYRPTPYRTPLRGVYLCSSATPPGGGVHGMCGFHAAEAALRDLNKKRI